MLQPYSMKFDGHLLARGFWLYIWEIKGASSHHVYVGRTGDTSSPHAQSPFKRVGQHLDRTPPTQRATLWESICTEQGSGTRNAHSRWSLSARSSLSSHPWKSMFPSEIGWQHWSELSPIYSVIAGIWCSAPIRDVVRPIQSCCSRFGLFSVPGFPQWRGLTRRCSRPGPPSLVLREFKAAEGGPGG